MSEIVTEADMLMEILAERGEAPISLIAHVIGVEESVIERWAKVLEKHGMVQLRYPLLGKPVVEFKAADKLRDEFKTRFLDEQKKKAELVASEMEGMEALFKTMDKNNVSEIRTEVKAHLSKVEGLLDRLKSTSSRLNVEDAVVSVMYGKLIDKYRTMLSSVEESLSEVAY